MKMDENVKPDPRAGDGHADRAKIAKQAALTACVRMLRDQKLTGVIRDRAAVHFLIGAATVADALGYDFGGLVMDATTGGYTAVLEALAPVD